jgi:protein-L-isoaspartate(D-aspartate) O-methyltransferase
MDKPSMTDAPPTDFATARTMMVDSQVRPNKVTDSRIIAAMRSLPREAFLPPGLAARAYADENVPLGHGRVMPAPMIVARMVQTSGIADGDRVLVVGSGGGYGAALLARCGSVVTAVEDDPTLLAVARKALAEHAPGVTLVENSIAAGAPARAPFDCIFIEGAAETLPDALVAQLGADGVLVMVRCEAGVRMGQAVLGRKIAGAVSFVPVFDCALPPLPALRRAPEFVF